MNIGEKAPDFKLVTTEMKPITNSDYKDKNVVLLFFPLAFTSVCTQEMCVASDDMNAYKDLDAEIVGVSVDSPFVLQKFGEENKIGFTLASDFDRSASKAFDTLFEDDFLGLTGFSKRSAYVIDKQGMLRYAETTDGKSLPDFDKIKETLKAL